MAKFFLEEQNARTVFNTWERGRDSWSSGSELEGTVPYIPRCVRIQLMIESDACA